MERKEERRRTARLIRLFLLHLPDRHSLSKLQHPPPRLLALLPRRFHPPPQRMPLLPLLNRPFLRLRVTNLAGFPAAEGVQTRADKEREEVVD